MDADPPVHASRVATGVGKTRIAARLIAETVRARTAAGRCLRPFLYAVPTHRLGEDVADLFRQHGISARVFRGRAAEIPSRPGQTMCDDLEAVRVALDLGAPVSPTCCKGKRPDGVTVTCRFYATCSYQQQFEEEPDVWVIAHQLLFSPQAALGEVEGVFIDEAFWQAGLWVASRALTLDKSKLRSRYLGSAWTRSWPTSSTFAAGWPGRCADSPRAAASNAGTSSPRG